MSALLSATEKSTVTNLTITGVINSADFSTMKAMTVLKVLDISGVSITDNKIPDYAFEHRYSLTSITIPQSVIYIGTDAFRNCGEINVDVNNLYYTSVNGVLFNKDMTKLIHYPNYNSNSLHAYTIPSTVTTIGTYAFGSDDLTSIIIPQGLKYIEPYAFYCSYSLTGSLIIPSSVVSIGDYAFERCYFSSVTILSTNLTLGQYVFHGAPNTNLSVVKVYTSPENLIASSKTFASEGSWSSQMELINNGTLYVPKGLKAAYQSAAGWNTIRNIVEYSTTPNLAIAVKLNIPASSNNAISTSVTANSDWSAASDANWLTVNPTSGSAGTADVSFDVSANTNLSQRTATVTISSAGAASQSVIITQGSGSTSIKKINENELSMFPNPVNDFLTISEISVNDVISIFDSNGQLLISQIANATDAVIDVSGLESGVYAVKVVNKNGSITGKFIKQ